MTIMSEQEYFEQLMHQYNMGGIYDEFRNPLDAMEQLLIYVTEAEEALPENVRNKYGVSLASKIKWALNDAWHEGEEMGERYAISRVSAPHNDSYDCNCGRQGCYSCFPKFGPGD